MAAAATDHFIQVTPLFSTVIGSGGVANGTATTIPLDSVSNLSTTTAIELVINRVNSSGVVTNNFETVRGVISGSNLTSVVRGVEGTAQAWDAGTTVEYLHTADIQNRTVEGILVQHNQDGTHGDITVDSLSGNGALDVVTSTGHQFDKEAYFDAEVDNGNSGTADTIDWTAGNKQKSTLTGNCTFTFTAPSGPANLIFKLIQDGSGSRTVVWPATVKWPNGTAPTLSTAAASIDIIAFYWDGSNYFGQAGLKFS